MDFWTNRWINKQNGWQLNAVNPNLIQNLPPPDTGDNQKPLRVFVPLCGQTHDLKYLVEQKGYSVFGIEGVESCIQGLNERDGFGLEIVEEYDNGKSKLYSTPDQKLRIYVGDLFEVPIETWGPFDIIWDRASLAAIEYKDREKYLDIVQRSVKGNPNFHYILEVYAYDKNAGFAGPPRAVNQDDMEELYGCWTNYNLVHKVKLETKSEEIKKLDLYIETNVYVIQAKHK